MGGILGGGRGPDNSAAIKAEQEAKAKAERQERLEMQKNRREKDAQAQRLFSKRRGSSLINNPTGIDKSVAGNNTTL